MHKPPSLKCVFFFNQKNSVLIIMLFCDLIRGGGGGNMFKTESHVANYLPL